MCAGVGAVQRVKELVTLFQASTVLASRITLDGVTGVFSMSPGITGL
jgi:hypothetical protein